MDFIFAGQRVRESTGTRSKTLAVDIERKRRRELEAGSAGIRKRRRPQLFSTLSSDWLDKKKITLAPKTVVIEKNNLAHLIPAFGKKLACDIDAQDICDYQQKRLAEGASPKTVNLEVGTLRAILRRQGTWAVLQPDVKMLAVKDDVGRAISAEEEKALLEGCAKSRSRSLLPFVVLALDTGARFGVIRTLQWGNVDFTNRCIKFGKDKTSWGSGRVIPLNPRAIKVLSFWADQFPDREASHYVFPSERYGAAGDGFLPKSYNTDPTKPIKSIKEGWEEAKKRAAAILLGAPDTKPTKPLPCRFHDLRHTAVSRMVNGEAPIAKIAKIVGWSPATMVRMVARYGHFALDELRGAVENISKAALPKQSPVFSPVSTDPKNGECVQSIKKNWLLR